MGLLCWGGLLLGVGGGDVVDFHLWGMVRKVALCLLDLYNIVVKVQCSVLSDSTPRHHIRKHEIVIERFPHCSILFHPHGTALQERPSICKQHNLILCSLAPDPLVGEVVHQILEVLVAGEPILSGRVLALHAGEVAVAEHELDAGLGFGGEAHEYLVFSHLLLGLLVAAGQGGPGDLLAD